MTKLKQVLLSPVFTALVWLAVVVFQNLFPDPHAFPGLLWRGALMMLVALQLGFGVVHYQSKLALREIRRRSLMRKSELATQPDLNRGGLLLALGVLFLAATGWSPDPWGHRVGALMGMMVALAGATRMAITSALVPQGPAPEKGPSNVLGLRDSGPSAAATN